MGIFYGTSKTEVFPIATPTAKDKTSSKFFFSPSWKVGDEFAICPTSCFRMLKADHSRFDIPEKLGKCWGENSKSTETVGSINCTNWIYGKASDGTVLKLTNVQGGIINPVPDYFTYYCGRKNDNADFYKRYGTCEKFKTTIENAKTPSAYIFTAGVSGYKQGPVYNGTLVPADDKNVGYMYGWAIALQNTALWRGTSSVKVHFGAIVRVPKANTSHSFYMCYKGCLKGDIYNDGMKPQSWTSANFYRMGSWYGNDNAASGTLGADGGTPRYLTNDGTYKYFYMQRAVRFTSASMHLFTPLNVLYSGNNTTIRQPDYVDSWVYFTDD